MSINAQRGSRKTTMTTLHLVAAFVFACLFMWMSYNLALNGRQPMDITILLLGQAAIAGNLGIFTSGNVKVHAAAADKPTATP